MPHRIFRRTETSILLVHPTGTGLMPHRIFRRTETQTNGMRVEVDKLDASPHLSADGNSLQFSQFSQFCLMPHRIFRRTETRDFCESFVDKA